MSLYKICPDCGSHLDHGERCDCYLLEQRQSEALEAANPLKNDRAIVKCDTPTTNQRSAQKCTGCNEI